MQIIQFPVQENSSRKVSTELTESTAVGNVRRPECISLLSETFVHEVADQKKKAAEPLKKIEDIVKVQDYLIEHQRYRDNLIFTMGINFGLRCGDLVQLRVGHIIEEDGMAYRKQVTLIEEKTGKRRVVYMNSAIMDAADLYFEHSGAVTLNDYLFRCESNKAKNSGNHLTVRSVERMLKEVINEACGIDVHASTHCMRKTFAYHMIQSAPDRSRAIEFLQKILGHSSPAITLRYAGITDEEIYETYNNLNLGRRNPIACTAQESQVRELA